MKKILLAFVACSILTIVIAACSNTTSAGGPNMVHMSDIQFTQSSITIKKGSALTLVDDTGTVHVIANGQWANGSPKPAAEAGAPTIQANFNGNDSQAVGTFNEAGTYHLYCTIHQNMNLTVIVQ